MALGNRSGGGSTVYLNISAGALWQKKDKKGQEVDTDHKDHCIENWTDTEGNERIRSGLRYSFIEGTLKGFYFYEGEYGESINLQIDDGEQIYTVSASTDNRFGIDLLKMLIVFDSEKDIEVMPYDFEGDRGKKNRGCSIKQDGKKLKLLPSPSEPMGLTFKSGEELVKMGKTKTGKEKRRRYFVDQNEEIKQLALEAAGHLLSEKKEDSDDSKTDKVADKKEKSVTNSAKNSDTSLLDKHKKRLSAYAQEEYSRELPDDLTDEEIEEWYKLSIADQELPFDEYDQRGDDTQEQEDDSQDNTEADNEGKSAVQKLKDKLEQRNKNKK